MKILFKTIHGSHLYGTNGPNSDIDHKGIYLPYMDDLVLGTDKACNSITKTNKEDKTSKSGSGIIEEEYFSLQKFFKLAEEGQTVVVDMLFSNPKMWIVTSPAWELIHANRQQFISKKLKTFIYYCKNQANKYGFKGSRLNSAQKVFDFLSSKNPVNVLGEYKDELIMLEDENIKVYPNENNVGAINVCGKTLIFTSKVSYNMDILQKFIDNYGDRAKLAAQNIGVDFKACSHFLRACFQIQELVQTMDLQFPLKDAPFLKTVKEGNIHYKELEEIMSNTLDETIRIFEKANLREKAIFNTDAVTLEMYNLY